MVGRSGHKKVWSGFSTNEQKVWNLQHTGLKDGEASLRNLYWTLNQIMLNGLKPCFDHYHCHRALFITIHEIHNGIKSLNCQLCLGSTNPFNIMRHLRVVSPPYNRAGLPGFLGYGNLCFYMYSYGHFTRLDYLIRGQAISSASIFVLPPWLRPGLWQPSTYRYCLTTLITWLGPGQWPPSASRYCLTTMITW